MIDRIALVTDFGPGGPYVGQMKLRLAQLVPRIPVIALVSDLTPFRSDLAAYLLPALVRDMPSRTLYLCVVDPGVGGERAALAVLADDNWYVGPDNGLLALVARRAKEVQVLRVDWRPVRLSDSFHGRDLFAPVGAMLCAGEIPACTEIDVGQMVGSDWPSEALRLIYTDPYGNLTTGQNGWSLDRNRILLAGGRELGFARTFCEVPPGRAFWYENSFGLVELAVNQGRADQTLGLKTGDVIGVSRENPTRSGGADRMG
jgi:S-adenosylmethionine hydrolase